MGFENPFEQQSPISPTPDESKRVEDIDKARAMAEAGDSARTMAAKNRKELERDWTPKAKEEHGFERAAKSLDKLAERREERAALEYDTEKNMESMSDEEVEATRDKVHVDEVAARKTWDAARDTAGRAGYIMDPKFVPEKELVGERPTKLDVEMLERKEQEAKAAYGKLSDQRDAIEVVLRKRWRKSEGK